MNLKQLMSINFKKGIMNAIIFMFFVSLTFYIILKDCNMVELIETIKIVDLRFIILAIVCMFFFILSEGINIKRTLKLLNYKICFTNSLKYAFVGFFFSSVTPSASGGDPMQLYFMKKDGLPIGHSTLAILTEFSSFQFVTIISALIGFITNYKFIENSIGKIKYFLVLGVFINFGILIIILLTMFSRKLIIKFIKLICKILKKIRYKNIKKFRKICFKQIKEYKIGSNLLLKNKKMLLKIILTTFIQIVLYHSIPYLVYLSFGLNGANFFQFISLQAVLYISVSAIPLPGAVGVSEGGFLSIYKLLFPTELLTSAMLLSRGVSFYLFVVISGISVLYFSLIKKRGQS